MRDAKAAEIFFALGDETRLRLVRRLTKGACSITDLTEGTDITRQAITKHLRVLEEVGLVDQTKQGRAAVYAFRPKPLDEMQKYLEAVGQQWDDALARLKTFVETDG